MRQRLKLVIPPIVLATLVMLSMSALAKQDETTKFRRIATFPVFLNTDINVETVSEIVAASDDGKTLVYTDAETGVVGFVDITDPAKPLPGGVLDVGGEPTSVAVSGDYALAAVNTSPSFITPSGHLVVIHMPTKSVVATHSLGGQPDSIAVSPDNHYASVVIENERDEDLGNGAPPQAPAGLLKIVDLSGDPDQWSLRDVSLTGLNGMLFPEDPEPEYVDINDKNIAVVTLQENNHIVVIDLPTGGIINHFSAGSVDLIDVDTVENDLIELNSSQPARLREPDGVNWINETLFATADEGDLDGGSRSFTIFNSEGEVIYSAANKVDHTVVRHGHYPENRSENKGNEPENVEFAKFGKERLLFVASERASVVLVYKIRRDGRPKLQQVLPSGVGPEGVLAIPQRNLLIAASEKDDRGDKFRAGLSIYQLSKGKLNYPTVISKNRKNGIPIPWGALSGLAVDREEEDRLYAVHDSFYQRARIFVLDIEEVPSRIKKEIVLKDTLGKLSAIDPAMVNEDGTVNLDQEGIAVSEKGGFWIASEGRGTVASVNRPFETYNLLLKVAKNGIVEHVVQLPDVVNARQVRFGFEGVTAVGDGGNEIIYVAIQREWSGDPDGLVRIARYDANTGDWRFFYYPLDAPESANGGWVGLSEISAIDEDEFLVVERDNQGNVDAAVKRIYKFSIAGLEPSVDNGEEINFPVLQKTLVRDLLPDLKATAGAVLEKIEGMAVLPNGDVYIVNDNDGVDDSNGETQLLRFKQLLKKHGND